MRKWVVVSISRPKKHIGLIQSWKLCPNLTHANDSNLNGILLAVLSHMDYLFQNNIKNII